MKRILFEYTQHLPRDTFQNILKLYYNKTTYRKHMMRKICYIRIFTYITCSPHEKELEDVENPLFY